MPVSRSRRLVLFVLGALVTPALLALAVGDARAAKSRIVLPETDAPGASKARATTVTPVFDAMRETSPGIYEGIVPVKRPDGSWYVALDERFMMFSVAQRSPGGAIGRGCVHGPGGVAAWRSSVLARSTAAAAVAPRPQVSAPSGVVETKWEVQ